MILRQLEHSEEEVKTILTNNINSDIPSIGTSDGDAGNSFEDFFFGGKRGSKEPDLLLKDRSEVEFKTIRRTKNLHICRIDQNGDKSILDYSFEKMRNACVVVMREKLKEAYNPLLECVGEDPNYFTKVYNVVEYWWLKDLNPKLFFNRMKYRGADSDTKWESTINVNNLINCYNEIIKLDGTNKI